MDMRDADDARKGPTEPQDFPNACAVHARRLLGYVGPHMRMYVANKRVNILRHTGGCEGGRETCIVELLIRCLLCPAAVAGAGGTSDTLQR